VHAANPRTVLVVQSSYPFAIDWADGHLPAILWSAHGGQEFGHALADVLTGDAAPVGRLTQTWYRDAADLPDLLDYDIIASDATYLYFRGTPLYPFGHGLTYTSFEYSDLHCEPSTVDEDGLVEISVTVRNTGHRAGDEVVQLYTRQQRSRVKQPLRQLRGFERLHLGAGEAATVRFWLRAADLAFWDVTRGRFVVEEAPHAILVGRSAADIRVAGTVLVRGERIPLRSVRAPIPATGFDDYAGVELRDASPSGGDAVAGAEAGGWIVFEGVDFGDGVAGCRVRLTGTGEDTGLALRLDDPIAGPAIGVARSYGPGGRYAWEEPLVDLSDAVGTHDLYVVFSAAGVGLESLTFVP
jgi:beta-glucosidase